MHRPWTPPWVVVVLLTLFLTAWAGCTTPPAPAGPAPPTFSVVWPPDTEHPFADRVGQLEAALGLRFNHWAVGGPDDPTQVAHSVEAGVPTVSVVNPDGSSFRVPFPPDDANETVGDGPPVDLVEHDQRVPIRIVAPASAHTHRVTFLPDGGVDLGFEPGTFQAHGNVSVEDLVDGVLMALGTDREADWLPQARYEIETIDAFFGASFGSPYRIACPCVRFEAEDAVRAAGDVVGVTDGNGSLVALRIEPRITYDASALVTPATAEAKARARLESLGIPASPPLEPGLEADHDTGRLKWCVSVGATIEGDLVSWVGCVDARTGDPADDQAWTIRDGGATEEPWQMPPWT